MHDFIGQRHRQGGYTLISLAMGMVVAGAITVMLVGAYNYWKEREIQLTSEQHMTAIKETLARYARDNSILPCAAPITVDISDAAFGVASDCTVAAAAGVFSVGTDTVRIGAVPVRTLGLPDDYIADGWGNRYVYAVTKDLTTSAADFRTNEGVISVVDTQGGTAIYPADEAMYVVVSMGKNGLGGYEKMTGVQETACPAAPAVLETQNCDFADATFRATLLYSEGANSIDDMFVYQTKDAVDVSVVNRYIIRTLRCADSGDNPNLFNDPDNCSTRRLEGANGAVNGLETLGDNLFINPLLQPTIPWGRTHGVMLYDEDFTSRTTGDLVVRANIPAAYQNVNDDCSCSPHENHENLDLRKTVGPQYYRYRNDCSFNPPRTNWDEAVMLAIFIDNQLAHESLLLDPVCGVPNTDTAGGAYSMALGGRTNSIVEGDQYNVKLYAYSLGNDGIDVGNIMWLGSMHFAHHDAVGVVEMLEIRND